MAYYRIQTASRDVPLVQRYGGVRVRFDKEMELWKDRHRTSKEYLGAIIADFYIRWENVWICVPSGIVAAPATDRETALQSQIGKLRNHVNAITKKGQFKPGGGGKGKGGQGGKGENAKKELGKPIPKPTLFNGTPPCETFQ